MAMNPMTNSGTTGGRLAPSAAGCLQPVMDALLPRQATIGASRITRVSLTTTATASAAGTGGLRRGHHLADVVDRGAGPRAERLRTSRSGCASSGSTPMASVPHSVTSATGRTVSPCRIRRTAAIAPIADAPQMENPVATSSAASGGSRNSRAIP